MTSYPVNLSLPGAGMIAVLAKSYEGELTDDFIQQWLYDLMRDYMTVPDYLLVSAKTRQHLLRIVMNDPFVYAHMQYQRHEADSGEWAEHYPNRVGGHPLTLVVFPGLPEQTLFVASLLEMKEEERQVRGALTISTRHYDSWKTRVSTATEMTEMTEMTEETLNAIARPLIDRGLL